MLPKNEIIIMNWIDDKDEAALQKCPAKLLSSPTCWWCAHQTLPIDRRDVQYQQSKIKSWNSALDRNSSSTETVHVLGNLLQLKYTNISGILWMSPLFQNVK